MLQELLPTSHVSGKPSYKRTLVAGRNHACIPVLCIPKIPISSGWASRVVAPLIVFTQLFELPNNLVVSISIANNNKIFGIFCFLPVLINLPCHVGQFVKFVFQAIALKFFPIKEEYNGDLNISKFHISSSN